MKVDNGGMLDFFKTRISEMSESSAKNYSKAFIYLNKFIDAGSYSLSVPTAAMLEEWCVFLYYCGFQTKTVAHYLDIYSALHKAAAEAGLTEATGLFKLVKAKVKNGDFEKMTGSFSTDSYNRIQKLITLSDKLPGEMGMYIDIFAVSVLLGCRLLKDVAMLKKSDIGAQSTQVATILERNSASSRQYVFPLAQSSRTPLQMQKFLETEISSVFQSRGIKPVGSVQETARSFWAYTAMKRGVALADIYAVLGKLPMAIPDIAEVHWAQKPWTIRI